MGEVVVSSEGGMEMEMEMEVAVNDTQRKGGGGGGGGETSAFASTSSSMVRWERFLPKMVMRVLLVEADDSTRQIIAALLRKCSYRVAAVSDGLKAWELLKGRPHNIDLILTEVDLPSISGFALLTLMMEHEICKNIPVIMMSSQDSVSTVYKCMMRGAADFLVKPLRKNELRNLWQHVWRRQASRGGGVCPPDESVAQQECEATAENNDTSNRSSGYMDRIQRNQERVEEGTDAQSSCTKPEMDTEGEKIECEQDLSSGVMMQQQEVGLEANDDLQMHEADPAGTQTAAAVDCETTTQREEMNIDDHWKHEKFTFKTLDSNGILADPSREAIDLIGAFDNYLKCNYSNSAPRVGANKTDSPPPLDLSLRRSNPSGSVNQGTDESYRLNHSDSSAFSRYINKALQSPQSTSPSTCDQQKGNMNSFARQISNYAFDYNSDTRDPVVSSQRHALLSAGQPEQAEIAFACPEKRALPAPIPVRGIRLENLNNAFSAAMSPMVCMQSGLSPMQSPGSAGCQQATFLVNTFHELEQQNRNMGQYNNQMDRASIDATDQSDNKQENKLEMMEDRGNFSSTAQSANSSFCNRTVNQMHNLSYGSSSNVNTSSVINTSECGKEETFPTHDRHSHRSMQREAALTKFRLKRKERCFEKKVRYESRKKLAEQRPRVKGQFVRQGHNESPGSS